MSNNCFKNCDCNAHTEIIKFEPCETSKCETISASLDDTGRLFLVNICLKNVLCNTTLSVGVILYVHDIIKGFKVRKIEVHCPCCCDNDYTNIELREFCFVLPETDLCSEKEISIRVVAQYTDIC